MAEFYAIEPRYDFRSSSRKQESIEYDINTLIYGEAELLIDYEDDISDDEFEELVREKAKEIKEELMRNGIWRNEFGQPIFLYC